MKTITFTRQSTPEKPALGYGDYVTVGEYVFPASTCPNPYKTVGFGKQSHWRAHYAMLAPVDTVYECVEHPKFGKCLLVANGGELPTVNQNKNHGGRYVASEIFVHCGGLNSVNKNWRGSTGCFTLHLNTWSDFIACFTVGEKGYLTLKVKEGFA